jgi:hypothetical protein
MTKEWKGNAADAEILRKLVLHGMRDIGVRTEKGGGIRTKKAKREAERVGRAFCRTMRARPKPAPNQKANSKHRRSPVDWEHRIMTFKKSGRRKTQITMGSAGSAQATRARLLDKLYCRSLRITTEGPILVIGKKK